MSLSNHWKYFLFVVILAGLSGIWLPMFLEASTTEGGIKWNDKIPSLTTYFISVLVAGSVDYGLKMFSISDLKKQVNIFWRFIGLIIVTLALVIFASLGYVKGYLGWALCLSLLGTVIAWRTWWVTNGSSQSIDPTSALGGKVE